MVMVLTGLGVTSRTQIFNLSVLQRRIQALCRPLVPQGAFYPRPQATRRKTAPKASVVRTLRSGVLVEHSHTVIKGGRLPAKGFHWNKRPKKTSGHCEQWVRYPAFQPPFRLSDTDC